MGRRRLVSIVVGTVALLGVLAAALVLSGGDRSTEYTVAVPSSTPGGGRSAADPAVPEAAVPAPTDAGAAGGRADDARGAPGQSGTTVPDPVGRDVVRTAQLTLEVADPTAGARAVRTAVAAAGGVVAEEQVDPSGASLTVRVPGAALDRLVDDLGATGTVVSRSSRAEDVTDQVVDLDSRVATQQASVTRVRALLAQATSIGDIVAIESELASRESDLDSLQRRLAAVKDRVALSTLTVELRKPGTVVEPVGSPPGFGTGLGAGWAGMKVIGTALATAAGFLLPFLPVLVVTAGTVWVVVRRRRRTRVTRGGPGQEGGV